MRKINYFLIASFLLMLSTCFYAIMLFTENSEDEFLNKEDQTEVMSNNVQ